MTSGRRGASTSSRFGTSPCSWNTAYWAEWYLDKWCKRAMRSRLEPIKKFVKTIRAHQPLIMNWFKAKKAYSSGIVEEMNRNVNLVTRKAFGF